MKLIFFAEDSSISRKIADSLKHEWRNFTFCVDMLSFFSSFFDDDVPSDVILIFSENALKDMAITIDSFMERYDVTYPAFTFTADSYSLVIKLNYNARYVDFFSNECINSFQKIVDCFYKSLRENKNSFFFLRSEHKIFYDDRDKNKYDDNNKSFLSDPIFSDKYNILLQLTKAQRKLFTYLLSNRQGVSKDEIARYLWESNLESKSQNVYVLVSDLRTILKEKTHNDCRIVYEHKKYKLQFPQS